MGQTLYVGGYALLWDVPSLKIKRKNREFFEAVKEGAFRKSLTENNQRLLINHKRELEIASKKASNLRIGEDFTGLWFIGFIDSDLASIESLRNVTHASIGFTVSNETCYRSNGENIQYVNEAKLFEISLVHDPAYPESRVGVYKTHEELKKYFRREKLKIKHFERW